MKRAAQHSAQHRECTEQQQSRDLQPSAPRSLPILLALGDRSGGSHLVGHDLMLAWFTAPDIRIPDEPKTVLSASKSRPPSR